MMQVGIAHDKIALVLTKVAKRQHTTLEAVTERMLIAGLKAERARLMADRGEVEAAVVFPNPCAEAFLRQICGDEWEICWWLSSCALPEEEPSPEGN
jgi:hypothetical protein